MTFESWISVLAMLEEEPACSVYIYYRQESTKARYAVFPPGQYIDIDDAPDIESSQILVRAGHWTEDGETYRHSVLH